MSTISKSPYPNSNKGKDKKKVDLPTIIIPSCIGGVAVIAIVVFLIIHYHLLNSLHYNDHDNELLRKRNS